MHGKKYLYNVGDNLNVNGVSFSAVSKTSHGGDCDDQGGGNGNGDDDVGFL